MLYHAKNGTVSVFGREMDYISFGTGSKNLVILPGLGDGLKTVKGTAIPFALAYRKFAKDYRVYVFSRKTPLEEGYTTRDMARDQIEAMRVLGISKTGLLGISQGGMIAQYVAIDAPKQIERLVLAVTISKQNEMVQSVINKWCRMVKASDYKSLFIDIVENSYSDKYLKKYRLLYPILGKMGKGKDSGRFLIQANACMTHNAYEELDKISAKTLVIGAECDKSVGVMASHEIAENIKGSQLYIYPNLGHGAYEEAKDFNDRVLSFLL